MNNQIELPNICGIYRDYKCDFKSRAEYLKTYKFMCNHYAFKVRVDSGWMFFKYATDYDTWKRQK